MGFFDKLKENITHGGVKLQLQAPGSVSMSDAAVPVSVTLTADDKPRNISNVKVEVIAETTSPGPSNATRRVIATVQSTQPFTLAPGTSQTVQLNLAMNIGAAAAEALDPNPILAAAAKFVGNIAQAAEAMDTRQYRYTMQATAQVDAIAFNPSASQPIQVTKPGTIGTGTTFSA